MWTPNFVSEGKLLIDIPDDANELCLFSLFVTDEVLHSIVLETNKYAADFLDKELDKLPPKSRFRLWKKDLTLEKLKQFLTLTF